LIGWKNGCHIRKLNIIKSYVYNNLHQKVYIWKYNILCRSKKHCYTMARNKNIISTTTMWISSRPWWSSKFVLTYVKPFFPLKLNGLMNYGVWKFKINNILMRKEYLWDVIDPSKSSIFVKFNLNQQSQVNKKNIKILLILNFF
jgi:hypothetical protein